MGENASKTSRTSRAPRGGDVRFIGVSLGDVLRLVIASAVVGIVMRLFGVDPRALWSGFFAGVGDVLAAGPEALARMLGGLGPAFSYVLYGAAVVVPVWIIIRVLNAVIGRR